jgi:hypothetical protein
MEVDDGTNDSRNGAQSPGRRLFPREAEELAAVLHKKRNEVNDMPTLLETRKEQLGKLEDAFEHVKWIKNRTEQQEKIYCELFVGIPEIKDDVPDVRG